MCHGIATMLFDGECGFCRRWILRWRALTHGSVRFTPYQKSLSTFPELTRWQCQRSVHLILPDHRVYYGAHAVFKVLALGGKHGWALWLHEHFPPFRWCMEAAYGVVARHRPFFSKFSKSKHP